MGESVFERPRVLVCECGCEFESVSESVSVCISESVNMSEIVSGSGSVKCERKCGKCECEFFLPLDYTTPSLLTYTHCSPIQDDEN